MVADLYAACEGSESVVVLTEWPEFAEADFARVASVLGAAVGVTAALGSGLELSESDQRRAGRPAIVDARNLLDSAAVTTAGCRYEGIGRR